MIWIYLAIYILGALFTGIFIYICIIKIYLEENSCIKFYDWLNVNGYDVKLFIISIFWVIVIPISIIIFLPIYYLIKRINKHYNIE